MRKISKQNFKSFFMWVIVFVLTLVVSMGGAYAYFTASAEKRQASATTGIIKVGFSDDTKLVESSTGSSSNVKIVPGSTVSYNGQVQNTGTADMYALLECNVTVDDKIVQTQYYTATGTKMGYSDAQKTFTTGATPIAVGKQSAFNISFTFDTTYGNEYKNKTAKLQVVARAIQQSHLTAVQATNQLLSGYVPVEALPSNYTKLLYIRSTGGAYIDTGVYPASISNFALEMKYSTTSIEKWLFGTRSGGGTKDTFGLFLDTNSRFWAQVGGNTTTAGGYFSNTTTGTHAIKLSTSEFVYDGSMSTFTTTLSALSTKYPLVIGSMNSGGAIDGRYFTGKIYYCTMFSGSDVIRKLVPCKNASGAVGLYDLITETFYTSTSSTAFVEGPVTEPTSLLQTSSFGEGTTTHGVVYTYNGDGSVTFNGTSTVKELYFLVHKAIYLKSDHKYLLLSAQKSGSCTYNRQLYLDARTADKVYVTSYFPSIFTPKENVSYVRLQFFMSTNEIAANYTLIPRFCVFTEIFGSGNEPSTVAQLKEILPEIFEV